MHGAKLTGSERLTAEMTLKDGKVIYELNGLGAAGMVDAARRLQEHGRAHLGRDEEVTWPSRT